MSATASQITGVTIVYSAVCSGVDQTKHQSPASLAFVRGIHRWPVNSPHKGPVTRKMFPFDDVIMCFRHRLTWQQNSPQPHTAPTRARRTSRADTMTNNALLAKKPTYPVPSCKMIKGHSINEWKKAHSDLPITLQDKKKVKSTTHDGRQFTFKNCG